MPGWRPAVQQGLVPLSAVNVAAQQRRRPLIDEELADRLLNKPRAEGAELRGPAFPSSNDYRRLCARLRRACKYVSDVKESSHPVSRRWFGWWDSRRRR
jgi:hypothetical protein